MTYQAKPTDQIIRIREAARLLSISVNTLYRMAKSGKIHIVKISERTSGVWLSELEKVGK